MAEGVVAALERQGRVLLCAVPVDARPRPRIVTEDGKSFEYPLDRLLWRARSLRVPGAIPADQAAALRALRASLPVVPPWSDLHAAVEPGVPIDPADLVPAGDDRAAAALALAAAEAGPLFRFERGRIIALTPAEATAAAERALAAERRRAGEAALTRALREAPGGQDRAVLPAEAEAPLAELVDWAAGAVAGRPDVATAAALAEPEDALEALDRAGLLPAGLVPALVRRGLPDAFPPRVLADAEALAAVPDGAPARVDLSHVPAWALDDAETVEVDDALSLVHGPGGERLLLVHIADVACAIPAGCDVDMEARRRTATVYLPERRVPMIPPELTARRLTLSTDERRAAITVTVRAGAGGAAEPVRIERTWVRLAGRLDYAATADRSGLPEPLRPALEMAEAFRATRRAAGARVVSLPSRHVRIHGGRTVVTFRGGGAGDLLVAEAMVACNAAVAGRLHAAGMPALWRAQDPPRAPEPAPDDPLFPLLARRMFAPARVSLEPAPHAGLGLPFYLQATSPIRRYGDLVHQRALVAVLDGVPPPHDAADLAALAPELFRRERDLHHAEGEAEAVALASWLLARRDREFEAIASRLPAHGRGAAWVPELVQECPFRWPRERGPGPAPGTPLRLRPGRVSRWRGRLEFDPV